MALSNDQLHSLLRQVSTAEADPLDCDRCFERLAEFAEIRLLGRELPEALTRVEGHLRYCVCCREEYEVLLAGLRALDIDGANRVEPTE